MEYKDYFQRHIDQLGKVLAAVLSEITSAGKNNAGLRMENIQRILKEEIDLDLDALLEIDNDDFISYLPNYSIDSHNYESLAELFLFLYEERKNKNILEKALLLLKEVKEKDSTYSMERESKIKDIERQLTED